MPRSPARQSCFRALHGLRCRTQFQRAFVDAGMPGMLPVINEYCIEQAVRTGLGLKAEINLNSPSTARTTSTPTCRRATRFRSFTTRSWARARCSSIWDRGWRAGCGSNVSMSNRTPASRSMTWTRPVLRRPQPHRRRADGDRQPARHPRPRRGRRLCHQAAPDPALSRHLRRQHARTATCGPTSTCRSAARGYERDQDFSHLGTRCEIKNMNSMRFIQAAIDFEARRQIAILEDGGSIDQETRLTTPTRARPVHALQGRGA
jgi:aspartyl-tRNA(Asn)/glutamyl-tRNA(Gln) amidotransferase subunit B